MSGRQPRTSDRMEHAAASCPYEGMHATPAHRLRSVRSQRSPPRAIRAADGPMLPAREYVEVLQSIHQPTCPVVRQRARTRLMVAGGGTGASHGSAAPLHALHRGTSAHLNLNPTTAAVLGVFGAFNGCFPGGEARAHACHYLIRGRSVDRATYIRVKHARSIENGGRKLEVVSKR